MIYGFDCAAPESVGIPSGSILAFMDRLKAEKRNVHGFLLYRHGKLISKAIAPPYTFDDKRHVYSISKSFTGTAIGIARDEGLLTLGDRLIDIFPESVPENISANLARMTVHDVLSMTCGHPDAAEGCMMGNNDWVKAFLAREVPYTPGTHFAYNSGGTYMLSAIITKLTGMSMLDYLTPRLFEPLGITGVTWDACPKGINLGGWGFRTSPVDMLKLGVLYLNGGYWNGKRIVSRDWVKLASSYKADNGVDGGSDWGSGYCYQMWRCQHNCFRGDGMCGQLIIVSPDKDMVLSLISEDNSFQPICDAYWETIFASTEKNLSTYRMDPYFKEEMTADDVLPENPDMLASLRRAEENWTALELLGGSEGKYTGTLRLESGMTESVQVDVDGDCAEFTLTFKNGLVKKICAGSGTWVRNHYGEFPLTLIEYMVANPVAPVSLAASFRMEKNKIFLNVQCTNSPHGFRIVIDTAADVITKTRALPPYPVQEIKFTPAE